MIATIWSVMGRGLRIVRSVIKWGLIALVMVYALNYSTLPLGDEWTQVAVMARNEQFDYVSWELNAIAGKIGQELYGVQPFMSETDRSNYVRSYMSDVGHAESIEAQINTIYADPKVSDAAAASAVLRAHDATLRASLAQRQPLAESILEGQVAAVLTQEGFGLDGQLLPPISMHFTQVPNLLVVSPRNKIEFDVSINLNPMTVDQMDALENQIDKTLNVSSLIVPLGGIALYPAMILESSSLPDTLDTFAHEWMHHYLFFYPLGFDYGFDNDTRIINESTADLFGATIAPLVLQQYYPELAPKPQPPLTTTTNVSFVPLIPAAQQPATLQAPVQPSTAFDFGAEMNTTRVTVDHLLAQGKVDQAEAYMEQRREVFVAHGYQIRKLNQAYFAFYGGYQSASGGAGGSDPIGPAVQAIKDQSPSILAWIETMRGITTRDQLLAAVKPK